MKETITGPVQHLFNHGASGLWKDDLRGGHSRMAGIVRGFILFSLLWQQLPQAWIIPVLANRPAVTTRASPSTRIFLQYTSNRHVLGFGESRLFITGATHGLTMSFIKAKPVEPVAYAASSHPDKAGSAGHASRTFSGSIRYNNPWPGVSVIYRAQEGAILKSEYQVSAGFSARTLRQIRIGYNRPVQVDASGRLVVSYPLGTLQESAPVAWQVIQGRQVSVSVKYILYGNQEAGFVLKGYDPAYDLIIDPQLSWSTFMGGAESEVDYGYGIVVDENGFVYVSGQSDGSWLGTNVTRAYTDAIDAFAAKLDGSGNLVWVSFLGGGNDDRGYALQVDGSGNVYVAGESRATWGSPLRAYTGNYDGFVAKLDSHGVLQWNTFLGGANDDYGYGIALDSAGNVYAGGSANTTWGAPVRAYSSGTEGFAAKFDNSGALLWNTFLGGSGADFATNIAADGAGVTYLVGHSSATWGSPVRAYSRLVDAFAVKLDADGGLLWSTFLGGGQGGTGNDYAYTLALDGGSLYVGGKSNYTWGTPVRAFNAGYDAFVAKVDSSGGLIWNTFLGGAAEDNASGISVDGSGHVCVSGSSYAAWGTPLQAYSGDYEAFAAKLNSSGGLQWHTFMGSTATDYGQALALDGNGNLYVAGHSYANWGGPVVAYSGGDQNDAFAAKLDASGALQWNTFLGGYGIDWGEAVAVDSGGNVYVAGYSTCSWGTPVAPHHGGYDAFAAKYDSQGNLLWNTFMGSSDYDGAFGIAVDGSGNVYLVGQSNSAWGAPLRAFAGWSEAYVVKLNSDGIYQWHTFLGSSALDWSTAVATDGLGNVYTCGVSLNTWGAPLRPHSGNEDAFVAKMNGDGVLQWNTFLGSANTDWSRGMAADGAGNVYVTGESWATWGVPVRAYASNEDVYAAKLSSGGVLQWNTFLGGNGRDYGRSVSVDGGGNICVGGDSTAAWGSPVRAFTSNPDGFAAKLGGSGVLQWNTFLGSSGVDVVYGISSDANGHVYAAGYSNASWGAPWQAYTAGYDAFAAKMDGAGALQWNAFFGGIREDDGMAITADATGNFIYMAGFSKVGWGTPVHPYGGGQSDVFVLKISEAVATATPTSSETSTTTHTPSATPTATPTPSATDTASASPSPTVPHTPTATPTETMTATFTVTETPTATGTDTATSTGTPTATSSATGTATATPGDTFTPTATPTATLTATETPTVTETATPPALSPTRTLTLGATATETPRATATWSATAESVTATPTCTAGGTWTMLPSGLPLLGDFRNYPNPFRPEREHTTIAYALFQDAEVEIAIYAYTGTILRRWRILPGEEGGRGAALGYVNRVVWDGCNAVGKPLAAGGYLCRLTIQPLDGPQQVFLRKMGVAR